MRKKRWLLLGLLTLGIAAAVLTTLSLLPPKPGVTKENFDRIEIGMTRAEVEAIFGGPPQTGIFARLIRMNQGLEEWEADYGDIAHVRFDDDNCVASKDWDGWPDDRSVWQKVADRLPWREREKRPLMYNVE